MSPKPLEIIVSAGDFTQKESMNPAGCAAPLAIHPRPVLAPPRVVWLVAASTAAWIGISCISSYNISIYPYIYTCCR